MSKARSDDFHCPIPIDPTIVSLRYTKIVSSTGVPTVRCQLFLGKIRAITISQEVYGTFLETAELHIYYDDLLERIGISNVKYGKAWSSAPSNIAAP